MIDKMWWKVFENTGNVDAYLLYIDIKNKYDIKNIGVKQEKDTNTAVYF